MTIPQGFARHFRRSPVTDPWEPLYSCARDGALMIALRVAEAHCNSRGFAHGGVIAALADNAMGLSCAYASRGGDAAALEAMRSGAAPEAGTGRYLTLGLSLDYISVARIGQWLEVRPRVLRTGRTTAFCDAVVMADDRITARASATFHAL